MNGRAENAAVVLADQAELGELRLVGLPDARADEPIDERRIQRVDARASDDLLVRPELAGTPAPLKKAPQRFRCQLPHGATLPGNVSTGALVHERTLRYVDDQHGQPLGKSRPLRREPKRRADTVGADLAHVRLQGIHHLPVHGTHVASIRYAENERSAERVAERGELVRNPFPSGLANAAILEDGFLELDAAVLAECELRQQSVGIPEQDRRLSGLPVRGKPIVLDRGGGE